MGCFMNKNRYLEVLDCYSDMVYGLPMFIVLLTKSPDEFIRNIKEKTFFEFMDKDVKEKMSMQRIYFRNMKMKIR